MEAAILFVLGCIVVYIGFRVFRFYENNKAKMEKIGGILLISTILIVFAIYLYPELSYSAKQDISDFFSGLFWLAFWACAIVLAFFFRKKYLATKKQGEIDKQRRSKEIIKLQTIESKKRIHKKALEQEYQRKLKKLEYIQSQNQKISRDIEDLKPLVSQLSIYSDNFLEQQPALLNYIEKALEEGKA